MLDMSSCLETEVWQKEKSHLLKLSLITAMKETNILFSSELNIPKRIWTLLISLFSSLFI